jgi:hypothetical protein
MIKSMTRVKNNHTGTNGARSRELSSLLASRPSLFIRYGILLPLAMIVLLLIISSFFITVNRNINIPAELSYDGTRLWINIPPGTALNRSMRLLINDRDVRLAGTDSLHDSMYNFLITGRLHIEGNQMELQHDNLPQPVKNALWKNKAVLRRMITFEQPARISFTKDLLLNL